MGRKSVIYACPICGGESGVTHGDQLVAEEICEDCERKENEKREEAEAARRKRADALPGVAGSKEWK